MKAEDSSLDVSVFVDERKIDEKDERKALDQEAVGITFLLMKVLRFAHEFIAPTGSLERTTGKVALDSEKGT